MKTPRHTDGERILAVFLDFENIGIGLNNRRDRFDINRVIERLVEKGKIVAKKAYADWSRFSQYTTMLHEAAIELIEIPDAGSDRQELGRHPPLCRCDGPGLFQGSHRHFCHRIRRQRFFTSGFEAERTGQARHRPGIGGGNFRFAPRQLR